MTYCRCRDDAFSVWNCIARFCLFSFLLLCACASVFAVPAAGRQVKLVQPDGTTLVANVYGDERLLLVRTEDGYTIRQEADGYWYYATVDESGSLVSTAFRVGLSDPQKAGLMKNAEPSAQVQRQLRAGRIPRGNAVSSTARASSKARGIPYTSMPNLSGALGAKAEDALTGTAKPLVLLVDFDDTSYHTPHVFTQEQVSEKLFSVGEASPGSMRDYYNEVSFNQFTVNGDVVGWITAPQSYSYYVGTDSGAGEDFPQNSQGLLLDIVQQIDDEVDFSDYDLNGDGYVDSIVMVFEGTATGSRLLFWPHAWALGVYSYQTNDGVTVDSYSFVSEQNTDGEFEPVGTFVHEFGHILGAPDLYDYDSGSLYTEDDNDHPVRDWCLMGTGNYGRAPDAADSSMPSHFSGFVSYYWYGWRPAVDITTAGTYTITQSGANPSSATTLYRIPMNTAGTEYLLIENRWSGKSSAFDHYDGDGLLLDDGLIIYYIDEAMVDEPDYAFFNDGTPLREHYGCMVLDAAQPRDVSVSPYETRADAAWCSDDGQILLSPYTRPFNTDSFYTGDTNITISNISAAGETMTFTVTNDGTADTTGLSLTLGISPTAQTYAVGDTLAVQLSVSGEGAYDFYLGLQLPDGTLYLLDATGGINTTVSATSLLSGWDIETLNNAELSLFTIPTGAPSGTYTLYFGAQEPTGNIFSDTWKDLVTATFSIP